MTQTAIPQGHASWLWYPGDMEVWLGNRFNNRRTERGAMYPPFWKQDSHWQTVEFSKEFDLDGDEVLTIAVDGRYNLMVDGRLQPGQPTTLRLAAGRHRLNVKAWNVAAPPSLYIKGSSPASPAHTDATWRVTHEDKIWIDETGQAHGSGIYLTPGQWPGLDDPGVVPSRHQLLTLGPRQTARVRRLAADSVLCDFGRETMGYVELLGAEGRVAVYYGESAAEALDADRCETLDVVEAHGDLMLAESRAFRYVRVDGRVAEVAMRCEYLPHDEARSGRFECSDDEVNRIWQVGAYTMDLTTREFMMDGIKRDRWTWSGDAIQSYLMNYYLRFDTETVKRTIRQLRGKDPVTSHVNTIMDYTFYWFRSVTDYYQYTGDLDFVREMYPRMLTLMDYVIGRLNAEGMAEAQADDWVFIDWVDFPMHKRGTVCFEQILLLASLEAMQLCQRLVGPLDDLLMSNLHLAHLGPDGKSLPDYGRMAASLRRRIDATFWSDEAHAYLHAIEEGRLNPQVTRFPNMMALLYGLAEGDRARDIIDHVLLAADVAPITTPYMRFYELEALCRAGRTRQVMDEIRAYWGGMLRDGATSFWEKYVPLAEAGAPQVAQPGDIDRRHLEMYGRPYGKSLCHAWGASPVYLLGRYCLGVTPRLAGYKRWEARPDLGGLEWMKGDVPTPFGLIHIEMDRQSVTVAAPEGIGLGTVIVGGHQMTVAAGECKTLIY